MRCYHCMAQLNTEAAVCPYCGKPPCKANPPHHLAAGTVLYGKFLIGNAIGEGGFGITYVGYDLSLDLKVAVKEFFPSGFANRNNEKSNEVLLNYSNQGDYFRNGKNNFLREAQSIAKFSNERGVVDVREFFTENNTAYIVMEFLDGVNLSKYISQHNVFKPEKIIALMLPVMRSLERIHKEGVIHRDISPDNIVYLKGGSLKLTDFGSARYFSGDDKTKSLSVVLKPGYAPHEQYGKNSSQGPWTDVYALCATLYKCMTGVTPTDAFSRAQKDDLQPPSAHGVKIDRALEAVIMHGLAVYPESRYQNMGELINALTAVLAQKGNPSTIVYHPEPEATDNNPARTAFAEAQEGTMPAPPEEERNITYGDGRDYFQRVPKKADEKPLKPLPSSEYPPQEESKALVTTSAKAASKRDTRRAAVKASLATLALILALVLAVQIITHCQRGGSVSNAPESETKAAEQSDDFTLALAQSRTFICGSSEFITINKDNTASYYTLKLFTMMGSYVTDESDKLINNENLAAVSGNSAIGYYGLRRDGTVVTIKKVMTNQGSRLADVEKFGDTIARWKNVVQLTAGSGFLAALTADGELLTAGEAPGTDGWGKLTQITADGSTLLGLDKNGVLRSTDTDKTWRGVASFSADSTDFCIKKDGTVLSLSDSGDLPETTAWGNILSLSYRGGTLIGLKRDRTAVAIGSNPPDVGGWSELAAVKTTSVYTVGRLSDGSFVIAGNNLPLVRDFDVVVNGKEPVTEPTTVLTHHVKFVNYDGTVLKEEWVEDGKAATPPADPVRPDGIYYQYRFKNWSPDYTRITSDVTIAAVFERERKSIFGF